jgi:hypothetical protein
VTLADGVKPASERAHFARNRYRAIFSRFECGLLLRDESSENCQRKISAVVAMTRRESSTQSDRSRFARSALAVEDAHLMCVVTRTGDR